MAKISTCNFGQPCKPQHAKCKSIGCANIVKLFIFLLLVTVWPSVQPSICFQFEPMGKNERIIIYNINNLQKKIYCSSSAMNEWMNDDTYQIENST